MALLLTDSTKSIKSGLLPLTDKLDDKNFHTWKYQAWLTIQTLNLERHLDPSQTPPKTETPAIAATPNQLKSATEVPSTESAAYKEWRQNDLALQTWLAASITKPYQNKILECRSDIKIPNSESQISNEKRQENRYCRGIQTLIDGLTEEYYGFTASVMGCFGSITIPEAEAFLIAFDEMLNRTKSPSHTIQVREVVAEEGGLVDFNEVVVAIGNPQEPSVKSVEGVVMAPTIATIPKVYVTAPPKQHDTAWYPDSGASHHVTDDPNNFITTQVPSDSNEQLLVGNGAGIPILQSGFTELLDKRHNGTRDLLLQGTTKGGIYTFENLCVPSAETDMHTDIVIPLYKENTVAELPISSNSITATVDLDTTIEYDSASAIADSSVIT
ncbi:hypothetical protein PIB30_012886 [Stylosanthes scabra]|uniref:Retrotransposon Copia-like N-terminal domain-containing protein n=1 Tax=Stylosanthes scabra TaxID=79078 RepID=A0ABU6W4V1_9FABA|nr:hypothetical protein [Stylosanthes scabra]